MHTELSVIIPVLNEAASINPTLEHLKSFPLRVLLEIIVVDGDVHGSTLKAIRPGGEDKILLKTTISASGRAAQMNAGAALSVGNVLLFLHADTTLSVQAMRRIPRLLEDMSLACGAFSLGIHHRKKAYRIIEAMANLRSRTTRLPYGDQAHFFRKSYFDMLGGFAEIPLMEDVEIMQRVKKRKGRCRILPEKVYTSARRWEKEGVLYCTLRNWALITLYSLGVAPRRLVKFYRM